ncbi:flavodoxin [Variovorax sp. J22P168]|uniref:flavodoxin n=1 Tax=Variovorax jilinensis TaxID=3053513 RepID=UPI0025769078|nr:flavodoxin [Variovorax sp. J22P168]MDM0014521.1 flavodoxin [Variovorax sp. J22P168]
MITGLAGLSLVQVAQASRATDGRPARPAAPALVAYFSRSGNTRVVAGLIRRSLDADLFEIVPAAPYPDDYLKTVEQAHRERDRHIEPELKAKVPDIDRYVTVLLGMPVWGETAPAVIRSFLSSHDLSGKTVIPFITHGGYGLGSSESVIARHAPGARLQPAFSMQADQERETMNRVHAWLGAGAS